MKIKEEENESNFEDMTSSRSVLYDMNTSNKLSDKKG